MKYNIHKEGLNIIFGLLAVLLAINVPIFLLMSNKVLPCVLIVISLVLFLLVVNFFRAPRRHFQGDKETAVVSSVDGKVVALEEVEETEYLHRRVLQLSVFMTILDVHANWVPVKGKVKLVKHHNGRFMAAYLPKSSTENERSTIVIETPTGQEILVRQIAGAMARRIVTYVEPGDEVDQEQYMGFIKFGSRVDIFLPLGTEVLVKLGDKTTGGVTHVARLKPHTT
ncbi:MAG: phosphatidylserine decarboxylase family protein [Muribaculaceae bacterium]|nr:phosphatidylserine decarboxylase family protein [Muribaculaceae bacterium]